MNTDIIHSYSTRHAQSNPEDDLGIVEDMHDVKSIGVGSGIRVSDGFEGSSTAGSRCLVCLVSAITLVAVSVWGVDSGLGSSRTSSLTL